MNRALCLMARMGRVGGEALKNHEGLHQEIRHVGGAHPHMRHFWVGSKATNPTEKIGELNEHVRLHAAAAAEHARLAEVHGHGATMPAHGRFKESLRDAHTSGKLTERWHDLRAKEAEANAELANRRASDPNFDPQRAAAHADLAKLHKQAGTVAASAAYHLMQGRDAFRQHLQLKQLHGQIEDAGFFARPRHEVEDDLDDMRRDADDRHEDVSRRAYPGDRGYA